MNNMINRIIGPMLRMQNSIKQSSNFIYRFGDLNYNSTDTKRNTFLSKYISHFIPERGPTVCCCLRDRWRRHILREGTSCPIPFSGSQGVPTLASPCKLVRDDLIGCVSLARLQFFPLCLNLTAWFSSRGLLPVTHLLYPSALIALPCLLLTTWQLVKAHGVTRN